jgi:hypothetical protein
MISTNVKVDCLKPWAIFFVLSFIGITVVNAIIGGVAGGIIAMIGAPRVISILAGGLAFLVSLPISYFCFRFAVSKFLLPKVNSAPASTVEPFKAAA